MMPLRSAKTDALAIQPVVISTVRVGNTRVTSLAKRKLAAIPVTRHALSCLQWYEKPCAFAMLHNAGNLKLVVQEFHMIAHVNVSGERINVIHDDFVGRGKPSALVPDKAASDLIELVKIDAVNDLQTARGIDLG